MPNKLPGYKINPSMDDGSVIIRRARKDWRCQGGHNGIKRTRCDEPIPKNTLYIEYIGETPLYESGTRYHPTCAQQQGLLIPDSLPQPETQTE